MSDRRVRVLLTNDDGPPGRDSPYIYGFARHLMEEFGWDVKVVIPSTQKSWIGKAFHIKEIVNGRYYYPRGPDINYCKPSLLTLPIAEDGIGDTSSVSRPPREDEIGEWVLLDATPATCANIALHNLYRGEIDLVISGPNLGRNSSSAFALSSGTIGAALSSSLSRVRAIALSYGTVTRPTPGDLFPCAHALASQIIQRLWLNWGLDPEGARNGEIDLYNINLPMIASLRDVGSMPVAWTRMWRSSYGALFAPHKHDDASGKASNLDVRAGGPDAGINNGASSAISAHGCTDDLHAKELVFKFSPDANFRRLIEPEFSSLPVGSDAWAIAQGWASVTPLRASFAEPDLGMSGIADVLVADETEGDNINGVRVLKMKL